MKSSKNERDALKKWISEVTFDKSDLYSYGKRKDHVELLMAYCIKYGVSQDDAESLRNEVVKALVTDQGMKGKDKHKGWKENVINDFNNAIQRAYVPSLDVNIKPLRGSSSGDQRIIDWAKKRWGSNVPQGIIDAAHQPMNVYAIMFLDEAFNRKTRRNK